MKSNEAPERIYIDANEDWHRTYTAFTEKAKGNDIEYTRTDAFIEKAEKYLKDQFVKDVSVLAGGVVNINFSAAIKNFVDYMKGE